MSEEPALKTEEPTWKTSLPFPHKWLYYIAVKIAVLAIVVLTALHLYGLI